MYLSRAPIESENVSRGSTPGAPTIITPVTPPPAPVPQYIEPPPDSLVLRPSLLNRTRTLFDQRVTTATPIPIAEPLPPSDAPPSDAVIISSPPINTVAPTYVTPAVERPLMADDYNQPLTMTTTSAAPSSLVRIDPITFDDPDAVMAGEGLSPAFKIGLAVAVGFILWSTWKK